MKPRIILTVTIAALLAGCGDEKRAAELEQLRAEKAALAEQVASQQRAAEQEKLRNAQAEAERMAESNRREAQNLADERVAVDAERKRIAEDSERATAEQMAAMKAELRKREDALKAAELKASAELKAAMDAKARALAEEKRAAAQAERDMDAQRERAQNAIRTNVKRTTDFFFDALDPYGDWDDVEGYGPVFQPREAQRDRNWRPYTDGEWVWSDYGWAWRSNEAHGWATSHYGRWVRHAREGWMWVPGSEWAPAWVSWRKSDTHIGWAPLPPEAHSGRGFNASVDDYYDIGARNYNFVLRERFSGGRSYVGSIVPLERNVTIIQTTTNVTNISYRQTTAGAVVVNNGPELAFVNARATKPLQLIKLERTDAVDARSTGRPAVVDGGMLRLIAPVIAHERSTAAPRVIRKTATREIDRGWTGDDAAVQKVIRDKAAAEARQAEEEEREAFRKLVKEAKPLPLPRVSLPPAVKPTEEEKPERPKPLLKPTDDKPAPKPAPAAPAEKPEVSEKPKIPSKPTEEEKPFLKPDNNKPAMKPAPAAPVEKPEVPEKPKTPAKPNAKQPADESGPGRPVKKAAAEPAGEKPVAPPKPQVVEPAKPSRPVIAKPDAAREKPEAVEEPKVEKPDAKKPEDPRASILKRKLTDEEKAALKEEGEKALKKLMEKLGQ